MADALKTEGNTHFANKEYKQAVDSYSKALELDEDGTLEPLYGPLPGMPAQNMRDFQGEQGLGMHTDLFINRLPSGAHRCAFLGDLEGFKSKFKPEKHSNMRCWDAKLPLTSLIVSRAQRIRFVRPGLRPAKSQYSEIMQLVLDKGWCRVDSRDIAGYTALGHAAGHHSVLELAEILLKAGANPSVINRMGSTPLHGAIMSRDVKAAKMLLDAGSNPAHKDYDGCTIEAIAAMSSPEILAMVHQKLGEHQENKDLEKGANCNHCGKPGATKRCGECRIALYCSRDCQRMAWKKHKKVCGKEEQGENADGGGEAGGSSSSTGSKKLVVKVSKGLHESITPMSAVAEAMGQATGMRPRTEKSPITEQTIFVKEEDINQVFKQMTVKVQVPIGVPGMDMLVYNKTRNFMGSIGARDAAGKELDKLIREKGIRGQKAYFLGYVDKPGELTLLVDKMLPTQPW